MCNITLIITTRLKSWFSCAGEKKQVIHTRTPKKCYNKLTH